VAENAGIRMRPAVSSEEPSQLLRCDLISGLPVVFPLHLAAPAVVKSGRGGPGNDMHQRHARRSVSILILSMRIGQGHGTVSVLPADEGFSAPRRQHLTILLGTRIAAPHPIGPGTSADDENLPLRMDAGRGDRLVEKKTFFAGMQS
jgi:hypothetical protein